MTAGPGPGPYSDPAGQGGAQGEPDPQGQPPQGQPPQGEPPYGQPPQGQPPYGQPPYGQPPYGQSPYGQQPPYPGYGPAPSAPTGYGAPTPVERPLTVRAGIGAFVGAIVLSVVAQVITFLNWDILEDFIVGGSAGELSDAEEEMFAGMAEAFGTIGLIVGAIFTALFALFVWFAWKGHNWARIVLWILAGLGVAFAPIQWATGSSPLPVLDALAGFELVLDVVAIVLLALRPSNEWYRYRGWLRATGQPG